MRSLKFRIWSERYKEFVRPDYNLLGFCYPLDGSIAVIGSDGRVLPNHIIEQYTGLQDRGKEIYEGDIVRWANSVGREITAPVVWNTRAWCWTAGDYMLGGLLEFDLEVVGNIHEDLKLLEAK